MKISEMFYGVQGEGFSLGVPSVFIRLAGCNINCTWCDTLDVWTKFTEMDVKTITNKVLELAGYNRLAAGNTHIVITGGEPVLGKNEGPLRELIHSIRASLPNIAFPYFEVETNGTSNIPNILNMFNQINCSPKLSNSDVDYDKRVNPEALKSIANHPNSWFKFVVSRKEDWEEIRAVFLPIIGFHNIHRVMLMPAATTREALIENSLLVWDLALEHGVRSTTRLQTLVHDNKHGY